MRPACTTSILEKIKAWYRLVDQKSIGSTLSHRIIERIGDPLAYIGKKSELWEKIDFLDIKIKNTLQQDTDPAQWSKIANFIESNPYFQFITYLDDEYPEHLKNIYQAPLFLTAIGDTELLKSDSIISIVGTRKPTQYGKYVTEKIVNSLVMNDFIVCSGLALGIDAVAHRKTIESNGLTIAVLAGGLDSIYPPQNKELAYKIKETGLLVSENMPCVPFEKYHFPQRNRIISGLSKAVCMIEGNVQSGAMITAKFALDQNKDIFALPGDILKAEAQGPNTLISKGARMILTPEDIVKEYNVEYEKKIVIKKIDMTEQEQKIYDTIKNNSPDIHIDSLVVETGMSIGELSGILFMLELKNAVRATGNNRYAID